MAELIATTDDATPENQPYVVIARRYRPQSFDDLIGQQHVGQALSNAIATSRVGHAYLFTGARGVGKTSTARIFAKALNCVNGPTATPCNVCDICQSVSVGEDVDVLEIDGASNRGIDEIRQLRQNVNVRPSRARFKIYIIDEVHMLTKEAFNALLKTLEEPPEHVKFIFCTTEAGKIPITILSRCQRFDFAGIQSQSIAERLRAIVETEGVEAEPAALQLLARRAAGSMRDSQSLLEQLLAFSSGKIAVADVHAMLGSAGDQRLAALMGALVSRSAAAAIAELDTAVREGVDPGQLLEQLFGYFRDCMAAAVGCPPDAALYADPAAWEEVTGIGRQMGISVMLAAMQILDHALGRMRQSTQTRTLAELALVRICQLDELEDLGDLLARLESGIASSPAATARPVASAPAMRPMPPAGPEKKSAEISAESSRHTPSAGGDSVAADRQQQADGARSVPVALTAANALETWSTALNQLSGMVVEQARTFDRVALEGPNRLVVFFKAEHAISKSMCEQPAQLARFEQALAQVTGGHVRLEMRVDASTASAAAVEARPARVVSPHQRLVEVSQHPLVQRASELFGAAPFKVDEPAKRP